MKFIICTFLTFITFSGHSQIEPAETNFAVAFTKAVENHDHKLTLKHLDKNYRKKQGRFLGGNTNQLLDELLGGIDVLTNEWHTTTFANIQDVKIIEVMCEEADMHEYIFQVYDGKSTFTASLWLHISGKKYGFIGAVG